MKYELASAQIAEIKKRFTYHTPKADQPERYVAIRDSAFALAMTFSENAPPSRELSLALTHLEEAVMFCNAAIARNE